MSLVRLGLGFFAGSGLTVASKGKELLILPVLLSLLGLQGYGEYSQIVLLGSVLSILVTCGMDVAIVRFIHQSTLPVEEMSRTLTVIGITSILTTIIWLLTGGLVLDIFRLPRGALFWAILIAPVESIRSVAIGYYRSTQRYGRIFLFFVMPDISEVAVLAAMLVATDGGSLHLAIWTYIGSRILSIVLALVDIRPSLCFRLDEIRRRLWFGVALMPKEFVLWLGHSADRFIVSYVLGPAVTGIYIAAYKLGSVVKLVSQPITFVSFPRIARAWDQGSLEYLKSVLRHSTFAYLMLATPLLVIFLTSANTILEIINYDLKGHGRIVVWVAAGLFFHTLQGITSYYIFVLANQVYRYTVHISLIFIVGLIGQYLLVLEYSLDGAAFGSFLIYFAFWLVIAPQGRKLLRERTYAGA